MLRGEVLSEYFLGDGGEFVDCDCAVGVCVAGMEEKGYRCVNSLAGTDLCEPKLQRNDRDRLRKTHGRSMVIDTISPPRPSKS